MSFPETVAAALDGRVVRAAFLVEMQFVSETMRLWNGFTELETGGHAWSAMRTLGQIDGLEQAINGAAPQATFSLSGVNSDSLAEEQGDPFDYVNQPVIVYLQFFNADWSTLDAPCALWGGTMQTFQESYGFDDSRKIWVSSIGVMAESWFVGRGRPSYSFYSDRDQQHRFSGDLGLEYVAAMQNYTTRWPVL